MYWLATSLKVRGSNPNGGKTLSSLQTGPAANLYFCKTGNGTTSRGIKQLGRDFTHSLISIADFENW